MDVYLDSSALIKLVIEESESPALRLYLGQETNLYASRLGEIEARRAIQRHQFPAPPDFDELLPELTFREIDIAIAATASRLKPINLRTVDAIHLATAVELRSELDAFVTYDARLADAARAHRLPVVSPA